MLIANILMLLQRAKKGGFQIDAARANDELTAIFLACFYCKEGPSIRGTSALDQLIAISSSIFGMLILLLDNNMCGKSQQVQQLITN